MVDFREYIESHGIQVMRDEGTELACLCPFHKNTDTPAFFLNKKTGLWICFNPSCGKTGSIKDLMIFFGDSRPLTKDYSYEDIEFLLKEYNKQPYEEDWDSVLEEIKIDFSTESDKVDYLLKRGFSVETLSYFEVCFSARRKRIVIPARNEHSKLVGFIGRTPDSNVMPKYLYSKNFPRKSILFNLNRAKKSDYVIVVEGSLDAMKVHQAGFSNVVSTLGASVTEEHSALLRKYFDKIVLFADNDEAGMAMTNKLAQGLSGYDVRVVDYSGFSSKDPGEMSEDDIRDAIMNAQDWLAVALGGSGEQGSVL